MLFFRTAAFCLCRITGETAREKLMAKINNI